MAAWHGLRQARGPREPRDAPATAKPEDRQTLDRRRQVEPVHQLRIEARDRKPGNRVDDDGADIAKLDTGSGDGAKRHLLEQRQRVVLEDLRADLPAMVLVVPVRRLTGVAALDPGISEQAFMA